ncbi:hypothetical protein RchiOBHm_Chr4g0397591 [Rosa chinensis]|uniref:Uncharacterized protein n=1 Tax=Rosa chinensis TaxID=74649 RepID=A0A2P6QS22_ROSCH|nr:hypothetical protein RchiOBHm_Chr4g0397591 [Rosa chinensis]
MVKVCESWGHDDMEEDDYRSPEPDCGSKPLIESMIYQRIFTTSEGIQRT